MRFPKVVRKILVRHQMEPEILHGRLASGRQTRMLVD
jgi:hypothetical protein